MQEKESRKEALRRAIIKHAVRLTNTVVFDFRMLLTDPYWAREAGTLLWHAIKDLKPQVLIGPGFGAAPLLFATACAALDDGTHLATLMVRDKRKGHHQKKWVEGKRQPAGSRALVIDDFLNAGSALALVDEALEADGHELNLVAMGLLFDMWQPHGSRQIATGRMPVVTLFSRHDIGLTRDCFDARPPLMKGSFADFIPEKPDWWRFALNEQTNYPFKSSPVVADDRVYVADDQSRVWCHDGESGDILWRYDSLDKPLKGIVQKLQHFDGSLVFACYDGTLTRLDSHTGAVVWRWRLDSSIHATPEVDLVNQRLFIATEQWNAGVPYGHLQSLDWKTGSLLWRQPQAWWPPGSPVYSTKNDLVFSTCNDQTVSAYKAGDGELVWRNGSKGLVRGKPAVLENQLYLATEDGWLHCLDQQSGELLWEVRYGQGAAHQFVQVHQDQVFVVDGRSHLVALEAKTGELRWMSRLRSAGNWCPVPVLANSPEEKNQSAKYWTVLSEQGHLAVMDVQTERKVWEGSTGMHSRQPPAIGRVGQKLCLAVTSNQQGLKLYSIHSSYRELA